MKNRMDPRGRTAKGKTGLKLRVLSYNIHQGLTIHRRQIALSMLKEAIKSLKADIVLLQEVAGIHRSGAAKDKGSPSAKEKAAGLSSFQLEALADEIWPYYAYGRNAIFSGGFHGNAILSKYPIVRWDNVDISVKLAQKGVGKKVLPKRGMLHAEVELPEGLGRAHVMGTHFGLLQYERHHQLKHLCQYVKHEVPAGTPFLVAGDFNDWREMISRKLARMLRVNEAYLAAHAKHARTFPARFPILCLDRIYFRGLELRTATRLHGRPWLFLSDHLPLMADFTLT